MPSGVPFPPKQPPCDTCPSFRFCSRSRWTCDAFERFASNLKWTLEQRRPSIEATRQAIATREHARQEDRAEERRARNRASLKAWRHRNLEHVREQRRAYMRKTYKLVKAAPKRYARMLKAHRRWRAANPEKAREHQRRYRERNRDRIRDKYRAASAARQAAKQVPAAAQGTERAPAGSARLFGQGTLAVIP